MQRFASARLATVMWARTATPKFTAPLTSAVAATSWAAQHRHCATSSVPVPPPITTTKLSEDDIQKQKDRKPTVPNPASCEAAVGQLQKELDAGRKGFDQKLIDECLESRWVSLLHQLDLEAKGEVHTQDFERLGRFIIAHEEQLRLMKVQFPPAPTMSWHVTNEHLRAMRCLYELTARKLNGGQASHGKSLEVNGLKDSMSGSTEEILSKYHDNKLKFIGVETRLQQAQGGKLSVWEVQQMALFFTHEETLKKMEDIFAEVDACKETTKEGASIFTEEEKTNFLRHIAISKVLAQLTRIVKQQKK